MSKCQIIHGDCLTKIESITGDYIIVTDPPFNIGYHYLTYKDRMKEQDYYTMLKKLIGTNRAAIIHYPEQLHRLSIELGKAPHKICSWVYNSNTSKQHRDVAFYGISPNFRAIGQPYKNPTDKRIAKRIADGKVARLYDWWNINQVKNVSTEKTDHPCQMPVRVMENIVGVLPNDAVILDPFMGSGTTGVACRNLDRDFIGIELDKKYFEIARDRICPGKPN